MNTRDFNTRDFRAERRAAATRRKTYDMTMTVDEVSLLDWARGRGPLPIQIQNAAKNKLAEIEAERGKVNRRNQFSIAGHRVVFASDLQSGDVVEGRIVESTSAVIPCDSDIRILWTDQEDSFYQPGVLVVLDAEGKR